MRPEHIRFSNSDNDVPGEIAHVERLGSEALVHFRIGPSGQTFVAKVEGSSGLAGGRNIRVRFDAGHLFDAAGNAIESTA